MLVSFSTRFDLILLFLFFYLFHVVSEFSFEIFLRRSYLIWLFRLLVAHQKNLLKFFIALLWVCHFWFGICIRGEDTWLWFFLALCYFWRFAINVLNLIIVSLSASERDKLGWSQNCFWRFDLIVLESLVMFSTVILRLFWTHTLPGESQLVLVLLWFEIDIFRRFQNVHIIHLILPISSLKWSLLNF